MIVPTPELWTAGEQVDAETMDRRARQVLEFLLEPPQAHAVQNTTAQSVAHQTWTKITLDATIKDNDGIVDLSTDRLTIQTPGWYEVTLGVGYDSVSAATDVVGRRVAAARLNGSSLNGGQRGRRDTVPHRNAVARTCRTGGSLTALFLNTGDYLELYGYQDSGVARNTLIGESNALSFIAVRWVSN